MNEDTSPGRFVWLKDFWQSLSAEQRLGVTIFGVCGLSAVLFSGWYIRAQIRAPFLTPRRSLEASRQIVDMIDRQKREEADLRLKDTDQDGLNDWDELNVYHVSPYLADTDSDRILDGVEIAQGTDPNCPKDKDCQPRLDGVAQARASTSSGLIRAGEGVTGTVPPPSGSNLNAAQIRQFLLANQLATQADLNGLSDQAIIELYQRASAGAQTGGGVTAPTPSANGVSSPGT